MNDAKLKAQCVVVFFGHVMLHFIFVILESGPWEFMS